MSNLAAMATRADFEAPVFRMPDTLSLEVFLTTFTLKIRFLTSAASACQPGGFPGPKLSPTASEFVLEGDDKTAPQVRLLLAKI